MSGPDLPTIPLRHGPWAADVFDPRADPLALGSRYVHGGYIAALRYDDQVLTARPRPAWDAYEGEGLPEVFEMSFGWSASQQGDQIMRIGAGRIERTNNQWPSAGTLVAGVDWQLVSHGEKWQVWHASDSVTIDGKDFAWRLTRELALDDDGLTSRSTLHLRCPWTEPVIWFAHPFFGPGGAEPGVALPIGTRVAGGLAPDDDGFWRFGSDGGFTPITGCWGSDEALTLHFPEQAPLRQLAIAPDWPLDKLVAFGTEQAFSIEPYLSRAWHDDEVATWTLRYLARS